MEDGNELSMSRVVCFVPGVLARCFGWETNERRSTTARNSSPPHSCLMTFAVALEKRRSIKVLRVWPFARGKHTIMWILIFFRWKNIRLNELLIQESLCPTNRKKNCQICPSIHSQFNQIRLKSNFYRDAYSAYRKIFYHSEEVRNNFIHALK